MILPNNGPANGLSAGQMREVRNNNDKQALDSTSMHSGEFDKWPRGCMCVFTSSSAQNSLAATKLAGRGEGDRSTRTPACGTENLRIGISIRA